MKATAILNSFSVSILTYCRLYIVALNRHTKFWYQYPNQRLNFDNFFKFKMALDVKFFPLVVAFSSCIIIS